MYPCMNIIIYSKYASVYAAEHSSVWEAVSRKHSDACCKILEFTVGQLQVVVDL